MNFEKEVETNGTGIIHNRRGIRNDLADEENCKNLTGKRVAAAALFLLYKEERQ